MRTNFSEESQNLLVQARKCTISRLKPVVKEELIFYALVETEHPLWITMKHKFGLESNPVKNTISSNLIRSGSDDPEIPENIEKQERYYAVSNQVALEDKSPYIDPCHLIKAIFLSEDNCIVRYFQEKGIESSALLELFSSLTYSDMAEAFEKKKKHSDYVPSRQNSKTLNEFYKGSDLTQFGRNLNDLAKDGKLDPVYFRDEQINTTIEILCRKQQNNPLLVGEAGVGKTAIVEGIAQKIVTGDVPKILKDKVIIEISLTSLVAGTSLRGQFEENIQKLIKEFEVNSKLLLFIDEIHMIVGAGGEKGLGDAANIFKPALARGHLRCIGATTPKECRQSIERDKALKRRFQQVFVNEPTVDQTIAILDQCKSIFEAFHGVKITDEAVRKAVELANKYIKDRHFPGKAIDMLDHTCARERIDPESNMIIDPEEVAAVVAKDMQVPITQLVVDESEELSFLENRLLERVIGQDSAVHEVVEIVHLTKMGFDIDQKRPEGVFLFVGPSGVGKTELAYSLTTALLGDKSRLIEFNMAEFKEISSINRLLGAAPGYIGFEQESRLASCVRTNPNSIILMDEIEKAHPDIQVLLRKLFEKGMLTTQDGESAYFSHATFILTSNIGADVIDEEALSGLSEEDKKLQVRTSLEKAVKEKFDSDFLNAVDKVVYFDPISVICMKRIILAKIDSVVKRLRSRGYTVNINEKVCDYLLKEGYSIKFGAKFLNKAIETCLMKPLTSYIMSTENKQIDVSFDNDKGILISEL